MAYETERAERDFRQNPPSTAPGQGNDDDWGDIGLGSSSVESIPNSTEINNTLSADQNANGVQTQQNLNPQQQMQSMTATEDKMIEVTLQLGKGIFKYITFLVKSLQNNSSSDWHALGVRVSQISGASFLVGIAFIIINVFTQSGNQPLDLVIGSLVAMIPGILLCTHFDKENKEVKEDVTENEKQYQEDTSSGDEFDSNLLFDEEDFGEQEEPVEEESNDALWDSILSGESLLDEPEDTLSICSENYSVEDALNNVVEITPGTQTRQYLFETFMKVLPQITPNFSTMRQISEDNDDFFWFSNMIRDAAVQVGTKDNSIPELLTVFENDFIFRLNCDRPIGIKEQLIADEVASTFSRDENNMETLAGVYATTETSTGKFTINLFKGVPKEKVGKVCNIKITLGDIYKDVQEFICNPKNQMPFIWGVNEFGKPIYCDIIGMNSLIISGEPRGGKSWKGQSIVAQLCMFNSPKEVEIYVFDGKNTASDYRYASSVLPHIRYFCGDQNKIADGIEKVLNKATSERDKILDDAGCINIKDYNEKFPNNKLPYMYIVVDEMMGLMEYYTTNDMKEESNRFKGLLSIMVSKLAYTGVRFILFPHRIVDSVISKNTYSLVSSRAVVCQSNPDDLKSALDVTSKSFPYNLVSPGDMAIRSKDVEGGKVVYCHAEMLTTSNETNKKLFEFIGSVWGRLEPECKCIDVSGSVCGSISIEGIGEVRKKKNSSPVDNTNGSKSYEYKGFDNGSSIEESMQGLENNESVDESFWDNF